MEPSTGTAAETVYILKHHLSSDVQTVLIGPPQPDGDMSALHRLYAQTHGSRYLDSRAAMGTFINWLKKNHGFRTVKWQTYMLDD